jgi:hypothetical protein
MWLTPSFFFCLPNIALHCVVAEDFWIWAEAKEHSTNTQDQTTLSHLPATATTTTTHQRHTHTEGREGRKKTQGMYQLDDFIRVCYPHSGTLQRPTTNKKNALAM